MSSAATLFSHYTDESSLALGESQRGSYDATRHPHRTVTSFLMWRVANGGLRRGHEDHTTIVTLCHRQRTTTNNKQVAGSSGSGADRAKPILRAPAAAAAAAGSQSDFPHNEERSSTKPFKDLGAHFLQNLLIIHASLCLRKKKKDIAGVREGRPEGWLAVFFLPTLRRARQLGGRRNATSSFLCPSPGQ